MKQINLCRCTNCMNTYEDPNPLVDAVIYTIARHIPKLEQKEDSYICKVCNTDAYLTDDIEGKWELTDASCNQYRKSIIPNEVYLFKEDRVTDPKTGKTETFEMQLDYDDYIYKDLVEACATFGYTEKQVSQWVDAGDEIELMLECIFELEK